MLDGVLSDWRVRGYAVNRPLSEFVQSLPTLAARPIANAQEAGIELMADELRRVRFDVPEGLELRRFLPLGIRRRNPKYPDLDHRPILVISPYLDGAFLKSITRGRPRKVLISRREALLTAPADAVRGFDEVYAFRPGLDLEPEDSDVDLPPLAGLHAKVFVIDDGWNARVAVGSANATGAALAKPPRNVEFMVELVGRKRRFGIDALLADAAEGAIGSFRSLIEEFDKCEAGTEKPDEDARKLDRLLDAAVEELSRVDIRGRLEVAGDGCYSLRLDVGEPVSLPAAVTRVSCWPATLADGNQQPLADGVRFTSMSVTDISAFLAIELHASWRDKRTTRRFARTIQLDGVPEDRLQRLLVSMVGDRTRLLRLLWLLLSPDADVSYSEFSEMLNDQGVNKGWGMALHGLLERMLETLGSDPDRLDSVASLLADLRRTEEGAELLGPEFDAVWRAVWDARGRRR